MEKIVIEPHYLPTTRYFTYMFHSTHFILDDKSVFEKQSYRNRCYIGGPNGIICLIVPLKKGKTTQSFKEVRIDYSTNWQHVHWTSIFSSYNNSPFFEHFSLNFESCFFKKYEFLLDLNLDLIHEIAAYFHLNSKVSLLSEKKDLTEYCDYRNRIHPKGKRNMEDESFIEQEYVQVFSDRFSFQKGMSILDLLFCEGPHSESFLQKNLII
ncbi:MAG: WbqC family protein [Bacteroidetes bacterium]|nr:WbqC family protein [Bacteroidota bacterium]MBL6963313.1 WbqC family protein [Bacteroidota bacterium]